jgi:succinyl-CoA synthetase beta subunit
VRVYEFEAKALFDKAGIPIPRSIVARDADEAFRAAQKLAKPVALKPQTLIKARGKAGLIKFADSPEEAVEAARLLFGRIHQGEKVRQILVEEKVDLLAELYLGIIIDYTKAQPIVIASPFGGVEIEEIAVKSPGRIRKVPVPPSSGLSQIQARELSGFLAEGLPRTGADTGLLLQEVIMALYGVFTECDCEMVEINPLGICNDGRLVALDAAMIVDEDALFRQPGLVHPRGQSEEDFRKETEYRERGWTYLKMEGDIGILSSGAGITMAILDLMREEGVRPANFLDTAQMDRKGIYDAFHIFYEDPTIKTLLVNIFAGLNRCDDLAEGIKDFITEHRPGFPVVVRMIGNREEQGKEILRSIGIDAISVLEDAIRKVVEVNGGQA